MVPTLRCGFVRSNFCFAIYSSVLAPGVDDLARDRLRDFLVAIELHGERGPPLRRRTQVRGVAEHRGERDLGPDRLRIASWLEALDAAATGVEIAHHVAEVLLRRDDLDGHHGFEQLGL